jgi:hypothetical protein
LEEHHFQRLIVEYPDGTRKTGIYNTFISTCQQKCRNFRDFFVDYVREWNRGRRDFGNLVKLAFNPTTN